MPEASSMSSSSLRTHFKSSLSTFASSPSTFSILYTHPPSPPLSQVPISSPPPIKTLFVLDSSFNPPSRAHLHIAKSALLSTSSSRDISTPTPWSETRLLLLLATENADKPPKPAAFEERLGMMVVMARDLLDQLRIAREGQQLDRDTDKNENESIDGGLRIDVGVTKKPYFIDKATAIDQSGVYGEGVEQVHLTGFDTLVRIFDGKYYGEKGVGVLEPFLGRHRIRALIRSDGDGDGGGSGGWGGGREQWEWLEGIRRGEREGEGLKREWAERIELVDGGSEGEGVSSTKAREAAKEERWEDLESLLGPSIANWVREGGLYREQ